MEKYDIEMETDSDALLRTCVHKNNSTGMQVDFVRQVAKATLDTIHRTGHLAFFHPGGY